MRLPRWTIRPWTIRLRLTALYGAVFLAAGAVLLAITYTLVRARVRTPTFFVSATPNPLQTLIVTNRKFGPVPVPVPPAGAIKIAGGLQRVVNFQRVDSLHQLVVQSALALAVMAVVSMALGWLVAGRALRPLRVMTATARQLSEHNLHERLPADGPHDELGDLAATFNALLGRLQRAFDSQRQFVANASHELRTPLTLERAVVEVALTDPQADEDSLRAMGEKVLAIGAQQEALIEALLTLARSQRGLARKDPVDLATAAHEVTENVAPRATAGSVTLQTQLTPAPMDGDPLLVQRLVSNLVDNAVHHNHPGGWVHVQTGMESGQATLDVTNSGPVVPEDQVERLLRPFERISPDRTSTDGLGLGLSIVAAIAEAHNATLTAVPLADGGLHVRVTFPPPRPPPETMPSTPPEPRYRLTP